jgi:hypothetical protein
MNIADPLTFVNTSISGHPGVTTGINQLGLVESFARIHGESNLLEHRMLMGKTSDGMGGHIIAPGRNQSRATGLLASLMCRI